MASPGAEIRGLREFRAELRTISGDAPWTKELAKVHRETAKRAEEWASFSAAGGTRQQATANDRIKGRGTPAKATLGVYNAGVTQYALGAFYGAKRRTGWYAAPKYSGSGGRQFPPWVGNSWEVGGAGGPYHINSAIRDHMDDILDFYKDGIDRLASRAFPD